MSKVKRKAWELLIRLSRWFGSICKEQMYAQDLEIAAFAGFPRCQPGPFK